VASRPQRKSYDGPGGRLDVEYRLTREGLRSGHDVRLVELAPHRVVLDDAGVRRAFDVARYPGLVCVDSPLGAVALTPVDRFPDPAAQVAAGSLLAPMPGTVVAVHVEPGAAVTAGQPLVELEAMKMRHVVAAASSGILRSLPATVGAQVDGGAVLAVVTAPVTAAVTAEEESGELPGESGTA
jgi:propionyl-CoA carboxylase alpha chain